VNYFGPDHREGMPMRYFFYHILGGPGPTAEGGVAHITTLAVSDERERCTFCQMVHAVKTGGPAAAIAKAREIHSRRVRLAKGPHSCSRRRRYHRSRLFGRDGW
jgi:hypothetical protein